MLATHKIPPSHLLQEYLLSLSIEILGGFSKYPEEYNPDQDSNWLFLTNAPKR
jgi:hypothetical protein